jgi:hypothetical protein
VTRTHLAALALALGVAAVSCSDEPEPDFAPPESTSPAPTEPETTSEPPEPEKLTPEETVRAWVRAQNLALRTGNTDEVRALGPRCQSCDDFVVPVEETYAAGGSYETTGWRIVSLKTQQKTAEDAEIAAAIKFSRGQTIPADGANPVAFGPQRHIMLFELTHAAKEWQVSLVGFVP